MQDPYEAQYLNPAYDANSSPASSLGDSLHPGDVGYEAKAGAVTLAFHRSGLRRVNQGLMPLPRRRLPDRRLDHGAGCLQ